MLKKITIFLLFGTTLLLTVLFTACTNNLNTPSHVIQTVIDGRIYEWTSLNTSYWQPSTTTDITYSATTAKYYMAATQREIFSHLSADSSDDLARLQCTISDTTTDKSLVIDDLYLEYSPLNIRFTASNLDYGSSFIEVIPDTTGDYSYTLYIPYKSQPVKQYRYNESLAQWQFDKDTYITHITVYADWYDGI